VIKSSFLDSSILGLSWYPISPNIIQYPSYSWAMLGPKHELLAQGVDPERPWKTREAESYQRCARGTSLWWLQVPESLASTSSIICTCWV
jgi:hypothetical protein